MSTTAYVINSAAWSGAGFLTGWFIAHTREVVESESPVPQSTFVTIRGHRITTQRATRLLGVVVILLAVFTVLQTVLAADRLAAVTRCQAKFNADFARVSTIRADLADKDREALNGLLLTIYQHRGDQALAKHAFAQWARHTQANENERADHPLPSYPSGACE